jgi:hypothetical protein
MKAIITGITGALVALSVTAAGGGAELRAGLSAVSVNWGAHRPYFGDYHCRERPRGLRDRGGQGRCEKRISSRGRRLQRLPRNSRAQGLRGVALKMEADQLQYDNLV